MLVAGKTSRAPLIIAMKNSGTSVAMFMDGIVHVLA